MRNEEEIRRRRMDWLAHAADAAKGKTLGDVKVLLAKADALRWVLDELGGE